MFTKFTIFTYLALDDMGGMDGIDAVDNTGVMGVIVERTCCPTLRQRFTERIQIDRAMTQNTKAWVALIGRAACTPSTS